MKIILLVEGDTEIALSRHLKRFLDSQARTAGRPRVGLVTRSEITLNPDRLQRRVRLELRSPDVVGVIGLIDVFPDFRTADEAKAFLSQAVGHERRFYPHAAQFDVEAWLLPYWEDICRRVGVHKARPGANPEDVNDYKPPSYHLKELYSHANPKRKYNKTTEMFAILQDKDLMVAADDCAEFKALLNTLLHLGGLDQLP